MMPLANVDTTQVGVVIIVVLIAWCVLLVWGRLRK